MKIKHICQNFNCHKGENGKRKGFVVMRGEHNKGRGKYCCKECMIEMFKIKFKGNNNPAWDNKKVECICQNPKCPNGIDGQPKEFYEFFYAIKMGYGKYCCGKCYHDATKGKDSPNWKGGLIKCVCLTCGKIFYRKLSIVKMGWGKFCCRSHCSIWVTRQGKNKDTTIEKMIEKELCKNNINYEKQVIIEGISSVDFYLPEYKIIIQCDGDYWHNLPGKKEKDSKQDFCYKSKGYKVFRFWEHDIRKSASACLEGVLNELEKD